MHQELRPLRDCELQLYVKKVLHYRDVLINTIDSHDLKLFFA